MRILSACLLALALNGCGNDPLDGKWTQSNGVLTLPGGATANFTATVTFTHTTNTFDVVMVISGQLSDTIEAKGTYKESGNSLTLTTTGFIPAVAPSGDTDVTSVAADGSQCIKVYNLGGLAVCFPSPQTNNFTLAGGILTTSVSNSVAGNPGTPITLNLTKS